MRNSAPKRGNVFFLFLQRLLRELIVGLADRESGQMSRLHIRFDNFFKISVITVVSFVFAD